VKLLLGFWTRIESLQVSLPGVLLSFNNPEQAIHTFQQLCHTEPFSLVAGQ